MSDFTGTCKSSGEHLNFKVCPVCGHDEFKVYVHPVTGWWFCFAGRHNRGGRIEVELPANERGAYLLELLKAEIPTVEWGEVELPLWEPLSKSALRYLCGRDIDEAYARRLGLVEWVDHYRVLVPYFGPSGELIFWTSRRYSKNIGEGPKYLAAPGTKPLYVLHVESDQLVLVEGVFDAMAVNRAGFAAVALHGKSLPRYLVKYLLTAAENYAIISIMLDTDALGAAFRARNQLLSQRAVNICAYPPGRDPAEMQPDEIREIVQCQS